MVANVPTLTQLKAHIARRAKDLQEQVNDADLYAGINRFMTANDKIGAIKFVRANRFIGLKEAKDFVEKIDSEKQY